MVPRKWTINAHLYTAGKREIWSVEGTIPKPKLTTKDKALAKAVQNAGSALAKANRLTAPFVITSDKTRYGWSILVARAPAITGGDTLVEVSYNYKEIHIMLGH